MNADTPFGRRGSEEASKSTEHPIEYADRAEIAKILRVSQRYVSKLMSEGMLPYYKLGKSVRFRVSEVIAHMQVYRLGPPTVAGSNEPPQSNGGNPYSETELICDERTRELLAIIEESNNPDAVESAEASLFSEKGVDYE
ncbi:helix-turn-helix domain-containing protein [bacterium]|nr:helix-turn-helix domain-containing protein [bacterium]